MRVLYLDCFSGISGDMMVGALRDLGVPEKTFHEALAALDLGEEIHAHFSTGSKQNISGTKFHVHSHGHPIDAVPPHTAPHEHEHEHEHEHGHGHQHGRTHRQIRELLERSRLKEAVKSRALSVFQRVAVAEGRIHGVPPEDVGFHEVGAVDSIGDIVAACAGIDALGPLRVEASVPIEGTGWITCAHGTFPLPAPATLEILRGIPLRQVAEETEFITPTGAALLAEFCVRFGPMADMTIRETGYGLGTRDTPPRPNVLRAVLGEDASPDLCEADEISQMETNLDDITPELASAAVQRLFEAGALDVFFTAAQMKKGRPGFVLTVLSPPEMTAGLARLVLTETSAFGVRIHTAKRYKLRREFREVQTPYGPVTIKLGFLGDKLVQSAPEWESCRAVAAAAGASIRDVHLAASVAAPRQ